MREILGVGLQVKDREQAVRAIDGSLASGQRLNVSFANAHTLNLSAKNMAFRFALRHFFLLNDGLGVNLASLFKFGHAFPNNLNGTDFVPHFLDATRHKLRIYLIGSSPSVIEQAAKCFATRWPRHDIVGRRHGFFDAAKDAEPACEEIRASKADLVLVGMGNPTQELWIYKHGNATGALVLMAVGALFDFAAGRVMRAPLWIRQIRCEWLFRLMQEPRRLWRRYIVGNVVFMGRVLTERNSTTPTRP